MNIDETYSGRELSADRLGRVSEYKVLFVEAVELSDEGLPIHIKINRVSKFTSEAIRTWAMKRVLSRSAAFSDGLASFRATSDAGAASRSPKSWWAELLGSSQTSNG